MKRKINCWEFFHCGRELEGTYYTCPAARDTSGDTINSGKNSGRVCWSLFGTYCKESGHGIFEEDRSTCEICEFFKLVKREEGDQFVLLRPTQRSKESK